MKTAPLLSIGIIFKNEARCIERCLQSLQPLRDAISCELIMADTGATDGSREIAERYADDVFDFPWIDDFAAARNSVMDRCRGKWYLSIDCDEWLDEDIAELADFLLSGKKVDFACLNLRDYLSPELEAGDNYSDFFALRLARMATGVRYEGAIHECWTPWGTVERLGHAFLHHDGYVYTDSEQRKKKSERNMKLLRLELEKNPEDLRTLVHCADSSGNTPDAVWYTRRALELVRARRGEWEKYGGVVLRNAAKAANLCELPEMEEWAGLANELLPDSIFVQVDLNHQAFMAAYQAKQWERAVQYGEAYRKGLRPLRGASMPKKVEMELQTHGLLFGYPSAEHTLLIGLADAYCQTRQDKKALQTLAELDGEALTAGQVRNYVIAICQLHAQTMEDAGPVLAEFYEQISREELGKQKKQERLATFHSVAAAAFTEAQQKEEKKHERYHRPSYTVFRCLANKCEAGRGAELMMTIDPAAMPVVLARVEDWEALPVEALEYALQEGVSFPLKEKTLSLEAMDGLAARMTRGRNMARQLALTLPEDAAYTDQQGLFWARALVLAALQSFDWSLGKSSASVSKFACPEKKSEEDTRPNDTPETGLTLLRRFVQLESALLPLLYTPQALAEENAVLLPPMHRWGLYCSRAFEALDAGRPQEYLAALRRGLAVCPGQKDIVQFLLDRFREDARPKASPELLALAEKVRMILAAYDPADPAVAALKDSPAYQQVAWIIEEATMGGLPVQ